MPHAGTPPHTLGRRALLSGSTATVAGLAIAGCGGESEPAQSPNVRAPGTVTIDFTQGDLAIANFAYALEQLEAAFYTMVNSVPASDLSDDARAILEDIGAHEVVHRDLLKAKLGNKAIPDLRVDLSSVDLASGASVLETAQTFEDLGVSAYNGAARFISPAGPLGILTLQLAGEIVSVEARHASAIRTLIHGPTSGAFAPRAFDEARTPTEVLALAQPFIETKLQLNNAP